MIVPDHFPSVAVGNRASYARLDLEMVNTITSHTQVCTISALPPSPVSEINKQACQILKSPAIRGRGERKGLRDREFHW